MEKIRNFRDISMNAFPIDGIKLKAARIYRSSTLDNATENDIHRIVHHLNIQTIIDLRGEREKKRSALADHFSDPELSETKRAASHVVRSRFAVDYMEPLKPVIWSSLSLWSKIILVLIYFLRSKEAAVRYCLQNSPLGQSGLYDANRYFLMYSQKEIKRVFDILAQKESYPMIIHCTAGKDRTGLTIALILLLLGVPHEQIILDYARSAKELELIRNFLLREIEIMGLHPEFADSPPQAMEKTLKYIQAQYGSVQNYLESIGVSIEQQKQIQSLLLEQSSAVTGAKL